MLIDELEPETDSAFQMLVPDLMNWQGASEEEIEKIAEIVKRISGANMPKFYHWFLARMGRNMGDFSYKHMDYSTPTILAWYNDVHEEDNEKFFKIGHSSDPEMELHMFYDFNHPARDDARVAMRQEEEYEAYNRFETFREMLATKVFSIHAVRRPVFCSGTMLDESDILPQLDSVLESLGFKKSDIPTGPRCGLYESAHATLHTTGSLDLGLTSCGFGLGGNDENILRHILGTIANDTSIKLDVQNDPRQLNKN